MVCIAACKRPSIFFFPFLAYWMLGRLLRALVTRELVHRAGWIACSSGEARDTGGGRRIPHAQAAGANGAAIEHSLRRLRRGCGHVTSGEQLCGPQVGS